MENDMSPGAFIGIVACCLVIMFGIGGCIVIQPQFNVYSQRLEGEAELAKAEYSKKVLVQEAEAKKAAASLLADAEALRAEGVARANKTIGDSLKGNEAYLRWLWVQNLENSKNQVIYIPTEAGLPITEAGRVGNGGGQR